MPTFSPPTYKQGFLGEGGASDSQGLMRYYDFDVGYSVLITGGVATPYPGRTVPSTDEINSADPGSGMGGRAAFLGGRVHTITGDEYILLENAGYEGGPVVNMFSPDDAEMEGVDTGTWYSWGAGTTTLSTDSPFAGTQSLRYTKFGGYYNYEGMETGLVPISPSTQYTVDFWIRASETNETEFGTSDYDSDRVSIFGSSGGIYIFPTPQVWTKYSYTFTSKPNAAWMSFSAAYVDGDGGEWLEIDHLRLYESSTATLGGFDAGFDQGFTRSG